MLDMAQVTVVDFALGKGSGKNAEITPNQLIDQAMNQADKDKTPISSEISGNGDKAEDELRQKGIHHFAFAEHFERARLNARIALKFGLDGGQ
jgi:predicted flap endonuclease-1-like 5' DNA nuclease